MPRALELEEFGLEVESEQDALVPLSRRVPLERLSTKSKKSSLFKWAMLVVVLAMIVFLNVDQEKVEMDTSSSLLEDVTSSESDGYRVFEEGEEEEEEEEGGGGVKKEGIVVDPVGKKVIVVDPIGTANEDLEGGQQEEEDDDDDGQQQEEEEETEEEEEEDETEEETEKGEEEDVGQEEEGGGQQQHQEEEDVQQQENDEASNTDASSGNESDAVNQDTTATDNMATTAHNSFTKERLLATRTAAQTLITMLEEYYYNAETASKMLIQSWVGPWTFQESPENKTQTFAVQKLVDTMVRALVTEDQKEFIIGTIGSSVAAGHDNCNYDSYEKQMQRTLGPVWSAAGMTLVCQNAGEGGGCGDDFANQVFCIQQNVSPMIDIAHYTWSYFEVGNHDEALKSRENLIRWTQMLPRQPPVHVLNVEGEIPAANDEKELQKYYAKYGYNGFYMRYALREGGHDYDTERENGIDRFGWGYVGDGYHNITRYGEVEEDEERRESLGVVMRNWHPGPLGFQIVSDAFSMVYAKAILIALDLIEDILDQGQNPSEIWSASKRMVLTKRSLPEPLHCDPEYCVVGEVPGCINYELPTYGVRGPRVEDPNDVLNPHRGEVQNWKLWKEPKDFWHLVPKEDVVYFQNRHDVRTCRHLDNCAGMSATSSENGMVVFRLPKMEVGLVAICGCCGNKEIAIPMFLNNTNIEVRYNGALLDRSDWDLFPNHKCARLLKRFPTEGKATQNPTGHAYLSVKALDGLTSPVRISHVITL